MAADVYAVIREILSTTWWIDFPSAAATAVSPVIDGEWRMAGIVIATTTTGLVDLTVDGIATELDARPCVTADSRIEYSTRVRVTFSRFRGLLRIEAARNDSQAGSVRAVPRRSRRSARAIRACHPGSATGHVARRSAAGSSGTRQSSPASRLALSRASSTTRFSPREHPRAQPRGPGRRVRRGPAVRAVEVGRGVRGRRRPAPVS